jgi:hypothetical protein
MFGKPKHGISIIDGAVAAFHWIINEVERGIALNHSRIQENHAKMDELDAEVTALTESNTNGQRVVSKLRDLIA